MASEKVLIIGGGIGGLAAGLSLLKRGLDVEIYEQALELKEVGAGIQISSNGTRVLYALGMQDALAKVGLARVPALKPVQTIRADPLWQDDLRIRHGQGAQQNCEFATHRQFVDAM